MHRETIKFIYSAI